MPLLILIVIAALLLLLINNFTEQTEYTLNDGRRGISDTRGAVTADTRLWQLANNSSTADAALKIGMLPFCISTIHLSTYCVLFFVSGPIVPETVAFFHSYEHVCMRLGRITR